MKRYFFATLLGAFYLQSGHASTAQPVKNAKYCTIEWTFSAGSGTEIGPDNEIAIEFNKFIKKNMSETLVKWKELFAELPGFTDLSKSYTPYLLDKVCSFYAVSMTATEDRSRILNIIPFYAGRTMVVVRSEDRKKFSGIESLKGASTVVIKNTTYAQWLKTISQQRKNLNLNVLELETGHTVEYLLSKKVDFIQLDTIQALYFMNHYRDQVAMAFPTGPNERIGWGFAKADKKTPEMFQKFISEQRANPGSKINSIYKKYFGVTLKEFDSLVFSSVQN